MQMLLYRLYQFESVNLLRHFLLRSIKEINILVEYP